jgi:hypothetical protein
MPDRREALKIMGAIGTTCAFPFASNELYGQHVHPPPGHSAAYGPPRFFTPEELTTVSRIADLIIPPTETPGAVQAGVPAYIDYVVDSNEEWRNLYRQGIAWLRREHFDQMSQQDQISLLERYIDQPGDDLPVRFFRAIKSMTADGFYTSEAGLVQDLGYKGNTVLASFPSCEIPEH